MAYINISFGLSLNDCYWVVSNEQDYKWSDYNLYSNSFNETLALVALTGISTRLKELSVSPELTTNGMLKKCWHKNESSGKIELYKGSNTKSIEGGYEAYCEYYMAQIAKALNLNAIDYALQFTLTYKLKSLKDRIGYQFNPSKLFKYLKNMELIKEKGSGIDERQI